MLVQDGVIDGSLDGEGFKVFLGAINVGSILAKDVVDEVIETVTSNV